MQSKNGQQTKVNSENYRHQLIELQWKRLQRSMSKKTLKKSKNSKQKVVLDQFFFLVQIKLRRTKEVKKDYNFFLFLFSESYEKKA